MGLKRDVGLPPHLFHSALRADNFGYLPFFISLSRIPWLQQRSSHPAHGGAKSTITQVKMESVIIKSFTSTDQGTKGKREAERMAANYAADKEQTKHSSDTSIFSDRMEIRKISQNDVQKVINNPCSPRRRDIVTSLYPVCIQIAYHIIEISC